MMSQAMAISVAGSAITRGDPIVTMETDVKSFPPMTAPARKRCRTWRTSCTSFDPPTVVWPGTVSRAEAVESQILTLYMTIMIAFRFISLLLATGRRERRTRHNFIFRGAGPVYCCQCRYSTVIQKAVLP